jgi:putative methanogenesis marker protein 8
MAGLVSTSPIPQVMEKIQARGGVVVDTEAARIDQANGVLEAEERGFRRIGVTVALPNDALSIRRDFPGTLIVAVHTTGISREEAIILADNADIVTVCASRHAREQAGPRALLQAGVSIPVFAMTEAGKALVLEKVRSSSIPVVINNSKLPAIQGDEPRPLV